MKDAADDQAFTPTAASSATPREGGGEPAEGQRKMTAL
jgi:hypothetical protein